MPWRRPVDGKLRARLVAGPGDEIDLVLDRSDTAIVAAEGDVDVTLEATPPISSGLARATGGWTVTITGARRQQRLLLEAFNLQLAPGRHPGRGRGGDEFPP